MHELRSVLEYFEEHGEPGSFIYPGEEDRGFKYHAELCLEAGFIQKHQGGAYRMLTMARHNYLEKLARFCRQWDEGSQCLMFPTCL